MASRTMSTKGIGKRINVARAGGRRSRWTVLLSFAVIVAAGLFVMRTVLAG